MSAELLSLPDTPQGPDINYDTYHTVYEYRYAGQSMRNIWSENHKTALMREVWVAVATAQNRAGIVTDAELGDLILQEYNFDFPTILDRETNPDNPQYQGHDILAAISEYEDRAQTGGGKIHQGMTSEDVLSNVEVMQMKEALDLVENRLVQVLEGFGIRIEEFKSTPVTGFTHIQAGEPITLGLRLSNYGQNFLPDLMHIRRLKETLRAKGIKGPVGTSAGVKELLEGTNMSVDEHEQIVMNKLGLKAYTITNQTYPRKQFAEVMKVLAGIGTSAFQFANNMRLLQSSPFDEISEPRNKLDKGSSAMPHKRNPRHSENIMSLARGLKYKAAEAEEIAQDVPLERGIDDSGGKRSLLPEAFLAVDEILSRCNRIVRGFDAHEDSQWSNLEKFSPYLATEPIMLTAAARGANRQEMHEILFVVSGDAIKAVRRGEPNPMKELVAGKDEITKYIAPDEMDIIFRDTYQKTGESRQFCETFLQEELYPAIGKVA